MCEVKSQLQNACEWRSYHCSSVRANQHCGHEQKGIIALTQCVQVKTLPLIARRNGSSQINITTVANNERIITFTNECGRRLEKRFTFPPLRARIGCFKITPLHCESRPLLRIVVWVCAAIARRGGLPPSQVAPWVTYPWWSGASTFVVIRV